MGLNKPQETVEEIYKKKKQLGGVTGTNCNLRLIGGHFPWVNTAFLSD